METFNEYFIQEIFKITSLFDNDVDDNLINP